MSEGLKKYQRVQAAHTRVVQSAKDTVSGLVEELGQLIAGFAPYVDTSTAVDDNDIEQITSLMPEFTAIDALCRAAKDGTGEGVFSTNLRDIFHMARNSFKVTSEEGDAVLTAIAKKCGEIASALQ